MKRESEGHWPILIVEDDRPTALIEAKVLRRSGRTSHIVETADEALAVLRAQRFSVILLDYLLVNENGWRVLEAAKATTPAVPVIVVTGRGNEEVAVEALRLGAADYIIKNGDYWEQLPSLVDRIIQMAEAARLRLFLASVVEASDDAIVGARADGVILSWNSGSARIFGLSVGNAIGRNLKDLFPDERRRVVAHSFEKVSRGERLANFETAIHASDGSLINLSILFSAVPGKSADASVSMVARDITARVRAEEQLRRAEFRVLQLQKFDAIRDIAGGVAHEFNNLMTAVILRTELIKNCLRHDDPVIAELDLIIRSSERASTVARNLQAYSKQQVMNPKIFNLNLTLNELTKMLQRLAGESITLETTLDPNLALIKADPVRINEVITNLILNAKEAMPAGGQIRIETSNVICDEKFLETHPGATAGDFVRLSITDTGCGMDAATLARVFDPFFTTKGRARRSGLGLAMVYGTIKQSDGLIYASSQPDQGSRFEIYFPSVSSDQVLSQRIPVPQSIEPSKQTLLIVEDDAIILELVSVILGDSGYRLLTADSGVDALKVAEQHPGPIDLLLTDVVMPEINGHELSLKLLSQRPRLKILFMSGYPEGLQSLVGDKHVEFIAKPFSYDSLTTKVRDVLNKR